MTIPNTTTSPATLFYSEAPADGSRAYTNINADPATGVRDTNVIAVQHDDVPIENLRGKEHTVTLDTAGFQFGRASQKYTAFTDDAEIEREYYPESIELVKKLTGASRIVPFDHSTSSRLWRARPAHTDHAL